MAMDNMTESEILSRLLAADSIPEKTVVLPRLQIPVTMKALNGKQVYRLREQCTRRVKENETLDAEAFNVGLVAMATIRPNWGDPQLLDKYNASSGEEVIKRVLLAGELASLSDIVLDLSGYNLELEDVKN